MKIIKIGIQLLGMVTWGLLSLSFIRTIRRIFLIRWGRLNSDRIGHFAANTELYFCEKDLGINVPKQKTIDIFIIASKKKISNKHLLKMWLRNNIIIWPEWFFLPIRRLNRLIPGGEIHEIRTTQSDRDVNNLFEKTTPHVSFTPKEEKRGMAELKKWGIPDKAKIVLVHSRDVKYLEKTYPEKNWNYHNYRNSNIKNFSKAIEVLCDNGCYVFRMGAVVEKPFAIESPFFLDYAFKLRSEFMDIFLGAKCHFYLGDSCGINAIPFIFRRPLASTNFVPLEYALTWGNKNLFIPKKHWLIKENRFMTLSEIVSSGAGKFLRTQQYENMGIELIENTPEEIAELGIEMFDRLNSQWKSNEKDENLQNQFWEIFPKDAVNETNGRPMHGEIRARIGTKFLRNNPEFLK